MANILIIGGTRFLGPELIKILSKKGHRITIFCRGNNYGVKLYKKSITYMEIEKTLKK